MKLEDRRFEKSDWPISFEIPVTGEQAERWSRYLKWGCHKRGWSSSSLGQLERQENSGTITVTGDRAPILDIVWEHRRDGPLKVRARLAAASRLSLADAEQFFREINNDCSAAATTPLYVRGTLQYDRGLAWVGEHWLDDETRLAPPSLHDQLSLHNGARIVHIDALLPCVGEPDVPYMRQQMLNEISLFLSVMMKTDIRLLQVGRVWTFTADGKGCEVRQLGYLESTNSLSMPAWVPSDRSLCTRRTILPCGVWTWERFHCATTYRNCGPRSAIWMRSTVFSFCKLPPNGKRR
jgi:hypothetical protein